MIADFLDKLVETNWTLNIWFPWLLMIGNCSSVFLTRKGNPQGWAVLVITQGAFIWYAVETNQHGFIVQNIVMIILAGWSLHTWIMNGVYHRGYFQGRRDESEV